MIKNFHSKTIPYICHFPGRSYKKDYGRYIFRHMNKHKLTDIILPKNLAIISFKTCDEESLLESQLKDNDNFFSYKIIDIQWKHIYRIKLIIDALKDISQEYILHLDAYDVMFNKQDLSKITDMVIHNKIIFNAEKNFYNVIKNLSLKEDIKLTFNNIYNNYIYKYLNAGCFFGNRTVLLSFFENLMTLISDVSTEFYSLPCDQAAIQLYWYLYDNNTRNTNPIIELDNMCNLFMCMNYLEEKDIEIL